MSWPALTLAPRMPVTSPRSLRNQRLATVGPRMLATSPLLRPDRSPKKTAICQISRANAETTSAAAVTITLTSVTPRTPMTAIRRPEIGPDRP